VILLGGPGPRVGESRFQRTFDSAKLHVQIMLSATFGGEEDGHTPSPCGRRWVTGPIQTMQGGPHGLRGH